MSMDRYDPFGMKSKEDFTETVKILVNYGADVNARNGRGETPMHLAARNEFQKVMEVLVLAGSDPAAEDNDGNQPVDLTSDGDTVSVQILRHAASERDRYMSESLEIRARGFTTLTQSQAALPLSVRSPSLFSMPLLMGAAAGSGQNLTRAASSPGLFPSPPQSSTFLGGGPVGSGYPVPNGFPVPRVMSPQLVPNNSPGTVEPDVYSNIPDDRYPVSRIDESAYRASAISQITAPSDNTYRLSVNSAAVYNSFGLSDRSSVWNVTPSPSVKSPSIGLPAEKVLVDVESESWISRQAHKNEHWEKDQQPESEKTKDVPERRRRKVLKKKSAPPPVAPKPTVPSRKLAVQRQPVVRVPEPVPEESDSYFDDESFDTFVESSSTEAEAVPPPLPPRTRTSSQASSPGAETSLRRWLDEQNGLMRSDHGSVTSDTTSFFSSVSKSTVQPERPPKLSRPSSVTSTDTVKRRPPPPIPTIVQTEKPKSRKKTSSSKKRLTLVKKVADVDSEDVSKQQAGKNVESRAEDRRNNNVPKSSVQKAKKKKKKELTVAENGDIYSHVAKSRKHQPVDTSSNSSWATNDTHVSEQKSPQTIQDSLPQLSPAGRSPQPLVFEKVTIRDDQIASDYLFHKSIAELTTASAENIVNVVGRNSSGSSPAARVGYSPETVFQYAVASSFVPQNSSQSFVHPQQQHYPASNQSRAAFISSSLVEPQQQMMQKTEDDLPSPHQHPQQNRPPTYFIPLPQPSQSELSPDDRSSGSVYDTLDEDKLNRCDSGVSDDQMPPYGLNRRTVVLKSDAGRPLGLSVCGGNVSGTFVRSVAPSSVAAMAGLTVGDWIVAVNSKVVKSLSRQEVLQKIENLARDTVRLVVDRDDDRFKLAAPKNAVGDSFHMRAHFSHVPAAKGRELTVRVGDVFLVSDSLPDDAVGYWVAKKVGGLVGELEGLIPNCSKAEQIVTKQRLASSPTLNRPRGGVFTRSFRRSKYSSDQEQDSTVESRPSSECGDIVPYVRVVEQSTSVRRPVVIMGLFCDAACALLRNSAPSIFEIPKTPVEQRRASYEEFTPSTLDLATIRSIINSGRHCVVIISPRAVQFLREKTDLQPIVIYMSPSSKNVLKSMIVQLAPSCDKKPGYMLVEAAKFERYHANLFDAVIPYKADGSWLDLLKDTVGRLQRIRKWIPFDLEDSCVASDGSPPDLIRNTTSTWRNEDRGSRLSKTTDDIPDQIQDLLSRHINVVSPMVSGRPTDSTADERCTQSFDFGDRQPVLVKPPKAVSATQGDVVLRKPRTKGRPLNSREFTVGRVDSHSSAVII